MSSTRLAWYMARLRRMSAPEVAWRLRDTLGHARWAHRQVLPGSTLDGPLDRSGPPIAALLGPGAIDAIPESAEEALVRAADCVLEGRLTLLGVERLDLVAPDWFYDPVTHRRAPSHEYAFGIDHRSEEVTGNVKQIWELSRLQHLTLLSAAWSVTRNDAYAKATDEQLMSWWKENSFLSGINWTSGIEAGIRLISFVWIRRLLDGWYGTPALFEENDLAVAQIRWHQEYLSQFRSRGSSANNHVIAEAAGQLVASCAFPWFAESDKWRKEAADLLQRELRLNTFPSGLNREQASDYHGFVVELGLLAAVEADACGHPLDRTTWELLARMLDSGAAVLDVDLHAPRQGDSDEGRALVLDDPDSDRWSSLLATGAALVGSAPWWPPFSPGVSSTLVGSMASGRAPVVRDPGQPRLSHFSDAGLTLLRTKASAIEPEIWCRCDGGPHGFLSIAGHAHADALSVEIRHGGTEILVDPGTYCYHGEPEFRRYFRSTLAHNTIELEGRDQSVSGGPFMWLRHADTSGVEVGYGEDGAVRRWSAQHDGYRSLDPPATHRRTVMLDESSRTISICDQISSAGKHTAKLAFHLGPAVSCKLDANRAELTWSAGPAEGGRALMELPRQVSWSEHRGESEPLLGWYSSSFGKIEPTTVLMGEFDCAAGETELRTTVQFSKRAGKAQSVPG